MSGHNRSQSHILLRFGLSEMRKLIRDTRGSTAVEFALVFLPVILSMIGIIQTGWLAWSQTMLHTAVDAAARCAAVGSTTTPCFGSSTDQMIQTANLVFSPLTGATFSTNTPSCDGGYGLIGTYPVSFLFVNVTVSANSCYPNIP